MLAVSDQKKRTLEALRQQHAAAKAKKLQDEQLKSQKKSNVNTPKAKFDTPRKGKSSELTPCRTSSQPPPNKGLLLSNYFPCNYASFFLLMSPFF
jgi:ribonuclease P protein subunit POP4